MENKNIIQQELMETAPTLASISRQMPYALPEGYFDELPLMLLGAVVPKQANLSVPEGYFESLPAILLQKAKASQGTEEVELEESFPLLESIGKKMPYHVPAGYFEQWEVPFPGREAPVIPISRPWRKVAGWAVAASILAIVSLFGYRYFSGNDTTSLDDYAKNGGALDSISTAELATALSELEETNLHAELESYGNNAEQTAVFYLNTVNFEQALESLSEEEIRENLEEQGYYQKKS
jgi:hypothetical protein